MNPREVAIFVPLILVVLWMGIYPSSFLEPMHASVINLVENYHAALADAGSGTAVALR